MMVRNIVRKAAFAAAVAGSAVVANAAAFDASALETEIKATLTPIGVVGAAILLVVVGIKVFKWIRAAM